MRKAGVLGIEGVYFAAFLAAAFVGCGGSSATRDDGNEGNAGSGAESGESSAGTNGGGSGGTSAGGSSSSGRGGSTAGGSSARGGTGGVGPIPPPGPVYCGGERCDPPLACCMVTGECFDPSEGDGGCEVPEPPDDDPLGRRPCASNAHCEAGEFCMVERQTCRATGYCQPIDNCGFCQPGSGAAEVGADNPCRSCGCDGNTYPDPQTACRAGTNVVRTGAACGETIMEGGAGSSNQGPRPVTPCATDEQCPSGTFCCTLHNICYADADRDLCVTPPEGTRAACRTSADCNDFEYCAGEGCDTTGGCVQVGSDEDCGVIIDPVCGCDGTSYTSAACAVSRGVRVAHDGECDDAAF